MPNILIMTAVKVLRIFNCQMIQFSENLTIFFFNTQPHMKKA